MLGPGVWCVECNGEGPCHYKAVPLEGEPGNSKLQVRVIMSGKDKMFRNNSVRAVCMCVVLGWEGDILLTPGDGNEVKWCHSTGEWSYWCGHGRY